MTQDKPLNCIYCKGSRIVKAGFKATVASGRKQRYQCQDCGKTFYGEE